MTRSVTILVFLGILAMVLLGLGLGFDVGALVIMAFAVGVGILAILGARKAKQGSVSPATCPGCGGLVSPNSPLCKHCMAPL